MTEHRGLADPGYALAATDGDARRRALDDVSRAARLARDLADDAGWSQVVAIEVHSAHGPGADGDHLVAVKIGVRPADLPVADRIAVATAALDEVAAARGAATDSLRA